MSKLQAIPAPATSESPAASESLAATAPLPPQRRRRSTRPILLLVVPLLVALASGVAYLKGGRFVETDNAYVKADKVPISAEVSGRVSEVLVAENQAVVIGQPLFRLDPAPYRLAVAKAEAKLAQTRTDLAAMKASYRAKQAEIALARTRHDFANRNQQRQAELAARHFISTAGLDSARENTDLAAQQINTLQQNLNQIAQSLGGSVDVPAEHHPSWLAAKAELGQARLDLARTEVHASMTGTVSKPPKPGQHLAAGGIAMALVASETLWIEANFTETDLTYVHPGQAVTIHVDTYPDFEWKGTVDSLSPATGAEFSVLPAQNASGNWVKIAQRVPVRISVEASPNKPVLRAGLSTTVEIDTGHRRRLFGLAL